MKQIQYEVNIKLAQDGEPLESQCECAAGKGNEAHCKHVGVVLLGVANMAQQRVLILNEVTTQKLQTFHQPTKKYIATPLKAKKLPTKRNLRNIIFSPYPVEQINKQEYNIQFRNKIINFQNSSMPLKQLFEPANPMAIQNDHLYEADGPIDRILKMNYLVDITKEKVIEVEKSTRGQYKNKEWHYHRKIRITASIFHTVCHLRQTTMPTYAKQILNKEAFKSKACTHGIINEDVAIKKYEEITDLVVEKCGLYISIERPYLGASPDGLLGPETIIEVKCPYTVRYREVTPESVPYLSYINGVLTLKKNNIYYSQIQGQLYVTQRKFCNLLVFTFKSMEVIFIERDDTFIQEMLQKLDFFYFNYFKNAFLDKFYYKDYSELIKK